MLAGTVISWDRSLVALVELFYLWPSIHIGLNFRFLRSVAKEKNGWVKWLLGVSIWVFQLFYPITYCLKNKEGNFPLGWGNACWQIYVRGNLSQSVVMIILLFQCHNYLAFFYFFIPGTVSHLSTVCCNMANYPLGGSLSIAI